MIIILIISLFGDDNTLYLMDKSSSFLPIEKEIQFLSSKNGLKVIENRLGKDIWSWTYKAKFWIPLSQVFFLQYNFSKKEEDEFEEEHLFRLRWVNSKNPLSLSLLISKEKYIGIGIGFWKEIKNNHSLNILSQNNNYLEETPIKINLEGIISNGEADLFYNYYKSLDKGNMEITNILYYRLIEKFHPGILLEFSKMDTLKEKKINLFTEPFVNIKLSQKNLFYLGLPMNWKAIEKDSLFYKRRWLGMSLIWNFSKSELISFETGFQKTRRELNEKKETEQRAIFGVEIDFSKNTVLIIRQGIELDFPLPRKIREYNNHTYLILNHCF
ncbi:MAG: hypothetical protein ABIN61_03265 [candidate division WOR-3 bacterium]